MKWGSVFTAVLVLVCVMGVSVEQASSGPAGPSQGLDVKIVNTPLPVTGNVNATVTGDINATITEDVNIVNSADSPLYVRPSDTPIPLSGSVYFDMPTPYCQHFTLHYGLEHAQVSSDTVPPGWIAVVKHVSCEIEFKGNPEPIGFVKTSPELWVGRGGSVRCRQYLPYPTRGPVIPYGDFIPRRFDSFSTPLEVYAPPDYEICINLSGELESARCNISGYLTQIPQNP